MNRLFAIGRLGRNVEMTYTSNGTAKAEFSIATEPRGKDNDPVWLNVVAWERQAETCAEYLAKGSQVFIEGYVNIRSWEGKDGKRQYRTEVNAQRVQFLDSRAERDAAPETAEV